MAGATSATTSINLAARNMKAIGKSLFCYFLMKMDVSKCKNFFFIFFYLTFTVSIFTFSKVKSN